MEWHSRPRTAGSYISGCIYCYASMVMIVWAEANKGLVRQYIAKMTGLGRAQVTRLIGHYLAGGEVKALVVPVAVSFAEPLHAAPTAKLLAGGGQRPTEYAERASHAEDPAAGPRTSIATMLATERLARHLSGSLRSYTGLRTWPDRIGSAASPTSPRRPTPVSHRRTARATIREGRPGYSARGHGASRRPGRKRRVRITSTPWMR